MTRRFSSPTARATVAFIGSGFALIGLGGLVAEPPASGPWIFAGVVLIFGICFASRALLAPMVIVSAESVTARSFMRSRNFPYDDLDRVEVVQGVTSPMSGRRDYLVFVNSHGDRVAMRDLNARSLRGRENVVEQAATCINEARGRFRRQ